MTSQNKKNGCPLCNSKNIKNCISDEFHENFFNKNLLGLDDDSEISEISQIANEKSNDHKENKEENISNYSFFSDVNENEKQFMNDFLCPKGKKSLKVTIDLINPEPQIEGVERENLLKENISLLSKVITKKLREIKEEEDSTKETDNIIKTIKKVKAFLKKKRHELSNN